MEVMVLDIDESVVSVSLGIKQGKPMESLAPVAETILRHTSRSPIVWTAASAILHNHYKYPGAKWSEKPCVAVKGREPTLWT